MPALDKLFEIRCLLSPGPQVSLPLLLFCDLDSAVKKITALGVDPNIIFYSLELRLVLLKLKILLMRIKELSANKPKDLERLG